MHVFGMCEETQTPHRKNTAGKKIQTGERSDVRPQPLDPFAAQSKMYLTY